MLDSGLSSRLYELCQTVELCDPSGKVLGRFVPAPDPLDWEPITPEITEEELDRRQQSNEWYTTQQVLERLASLERS
jgi:hypothetical protein